MANEFDSIIQYRWGFDWFRTAKRYGLGVELHVNGTFLIGVRVGSFWMSYGWQLKRHEATNATYIGILTGGNDDG